MKDLYAQTSPSKKSAKALTGRPVYIVDGSRTPYLKARGKPGPFSASDLAVATCRQLLARQKFDAEAIEEVITGCAMPREDEANISRIIALRLGCGADTPAWTVHRNCASGMQAIDDAVKDIALGRHDLVLAGGTEAMSRAPLIFNNGMVNWFAGLYAARKPLAKLKQFAKFRLRFLKPIIGLMKGLTDPLVNMIMGQTAEKITYRLHVSREAMDEYATNSHMRVVAAMNNGNLSEITPIYDNTGHVYETDDGVRPDTSKEKLATLKPIFDKKFGKVTAANSAQVTDGAAYVILASEEAVKQYDLPVLGKIIDINWAGNDPAEMGLAPAHAIVPLMQRHNLKISDINFWEINEAFAGQVLACVEALDDKAYCQQFLGLDHPFGRIDLENLNVDGGGVALGHPVGSSGARIVLHLLHVLKRNHVKRGVAAICIGGGQAGAMLLETV